MGIFFEDDEHVRSTLTVMTAEHGLPKVLVILADILRIMRGLSSITTQCKKLEKAESKIREAINCMYED